MLSSRGTYTSDHLLQGIAHTHTTTAAHIVYQPGELRAVWAALGACVRRALILGSPALAAPASVGGIAVAAPAAGGSRASSSALVRPASAGPGSRPSSAVSSSSANVIVGGSRVSRGNPSSSAAATAASARRPSSAGAAAGRSAAAAPAATTNEGVRTAVSLFRRSIFFWTSPTVVATEAAGFHRGETRYCVRTPHIGFGTPFATTYGLNTTTANGRLSLLAPQALLALPATNGAAAAFAGSRGVVGPAAALLVDDVALSVAALAAEARVPGHVAAACLGDIVRSIGEMLHAGRVLQLRLPGVGTILLKADRVQTHWDDDFIAALLEADTRRWPAEVAAMAATRFLRPSSASSSGLGDERGAHAAGAHTAARGVIPPARPDSDGDDETMEGNDVGEDYENVIVRTQQPRRPPSTTTTTSHVAPALPFRPASGGPCTVEELERRAANARRAQIVHAAAKFSRVGNSDLLTAASAAAPSGGVLPSRRPPLAMPGSGVRFTNATVAGSSLAVECHADPLASVTPPMAVCCDEVVPSSLLPRAVAGRLADGTPVRMGRQESVYDMVLPPPPPAAEVVGGIRLNGASTAVVGGPVPVINRAAPLGIKNMNTPGPLPTSAANAMCAVTAPAPTSIQQLPQDQQQQHPQQQSAKPLHHHHTHTDIFGFRPQSADELRAGAEAEWGPARGRKRFGIVSGGGAV